MPRLLLVPLMLSACDPSRVFACERDLQCQIDDEIAGICESTGYCSFGDFACPSGRRYDELADPSLANECVGGEVARCVFDLEIGDASMCARRRDGTLACWGRNSDGQLTGELALQQLVPATPEALRAVAEVRIGERHTCLRTSHDRVQCLGKNTFGQLGDGSIEGRSAPVAPLGLGSVRALDVLGEHTCAVVSFDGGVACWGRNVEGQVGDGSREGRHAPVRVRAADGGELVGASAVTTGRRHACALAGGRVLCWGSNTRGQLGDGTLEQRAVAVEVPGLAGIVEVVAGREHTCARDGEGRVWCWGSTTSGQIGNGVIADGAEPLPVPVPLAAPAAALALGHDHGCALVGRQAWCWGKNAEGQLAAPASAGVATPVRVELPDAAELAAGFHNTCVIGEAGDIWCRGSNSEGQLATGSAGGAPVTVPTRLPALCE